MEGSKVLVCIKWLSVWQDVVLRTLFLREIQSKLEWHYLHDFISDSKLKSYSSCARVKEMKCLEENKLRIKVRAPDLWYKVLATRCDHLNSSVSMQSIGTLNLKFSLKIFVDMYRFVVWHLDARPPGISYWRDSIINGKMFYTALCRP